MTWLNQLKVGDQFYDESKNFVGTVIAISDTGFTWQWTNLITGKNLDKMSDTFIEWDDDRLELTGWIPKSGLMDELL